ncbi:phosphotriesterase [Chloroflexota bacterium]
MNEIPTLTGSVSPDQLGIVSLSEHLLFGLPGWWYAPEVNFDRSAAFDQICSSLKEFKELGGGTIVDTSGITMGRNVPFYSKLAEVTGVQIVAATGFDSQPLSIPGHFFTHCFLYSNVQGPYYWFREVPGSFYPSYGATKEYMMYLFYNELVRGMVAPGMIRTSIKAGIAKAASSWDQITQIEELSVQGAALAAKRAGVALIIGGINGINQARQQMEMVLEEGLEPDRIVVGHSDDGRAIDLERDKELAQKGAYVAYDHVGWEDTSVPHAVPDERRVELVKAMVDAGFAERIVLSCNAIGHAIDVPQPGHSFGHLLKNFVPKLKKAGVSDSTIDTILIENPKRILTHRGEIKYARPAYFGSRAP